MNKKCPSCGTSNAKSNRHCRQCGHQFADSSGGGLGTLLFWLFIGWWLKPIIALFRWNPKIASIIVAVLFIGGVFGGAVRQCDRDEVDSAILNGDGLSTHQKEFTSAMQQAFTKLKSAESAANRLSLFNSTIYPLLTKFVSNPQISWVLVTETVTLSADNKTASLQARIPGTGLIVGTPREYQYLPANTPDTRLRDGTTLFQAGIALKEGDRFTATMNLRDSKDRLQELFKKSYRASSEDLIIVQFLSIEPIAEKK